MPGARQHLAGGSACQGSRRMHHPCTPSRKWLRAKICHHGRAFEDAGRGPLTTSLRSSTAGATLSFAMPLVPRPIVVLRWLSPTSCERRMPWSGLLVAQTAVVFVFFPQVGLRVALRRREAVADRPTVPWPGRHSAGPYLFFSWSGPSDRCWDPQSQSTDTIIV
jgi:hypothetical protein